MMIPFFRKPYQDTIWPESIQTGPIFLLISSKNMDKIQINENFGNGKRANSL